MALILLLAVITITLPLINIISQPAEWLNAFSLPYWVYLGAGLILLSWLLKD